MADRTSAELFGKNPTTEQKLEALKVDIREKIPRLMELSTGCLIRIFSDLYVVPYEIKPIIQSNSMFVFERKTQYFEKEYEIIGHEPMLSDVLKWHSKHYSKYSHFEITAGVGRFIVYDSEENFEIEIDLSKPYLKDWSSELIDFLYNLLNENK